MALVGSVLFTARLSFAEPVVVAESTTMCDLDGNGVCDQRDHALFSRTYRRCRGDGEFVERFDADGDGCVWLSDHYAFFGTPPESPRRRVSELADEALRLWHGHQYIGATKKMEEALQLAEKALGTDDNATIMIVHDVAALYQLQGFYRQAEPFYQAELAHWERVSTDDTYVLADAVRNLGHFYHQWSQTEPDRSKQAEQLYRRALTLIKQKVAMVDWQKRLPVELLVSLGELCFRQDRRAEAADSFRQALEIWERLDYPALRPKREWLKHYAEILRQSGRIAEAQAVEAKRELSPDMNSPDPEEKPE